jgi:hypothetical protein
MPLPSLYIAGNGARAWSIARAAAYGAGIGALAALLKAIGPLREAGLGTENLTEKLASNFAEIAGVAIAFALLCVGAAALRNFIARRLIWPEVR